jgi:glucose-6-phosphate 1-dehydrogenase
MGKKQNIHKSAVFKFPPTILTIFGATGSLTSDYLLPALLHMDRENLLPAEFRLVCVGRRKFTGEEYLNFIVSKSASLKKIEKGVKKHFLKRMVYYKGDFEDLNSFEALTKLLDDKDSPKHICYNRLFYFATSPQFFSSIAKMLKNTGLLRACAEHDRKIRVLVEKPFGFNLKSAQALNKLLLKYFTEDQIYRIDHYLGKETVQNLMVVRFANSLFEPLWNNRFIDHVEISVLEEEGVGKRAPYYEQTGALKDMVQNHILQMLALIAMDEPYDLSAKMIRDEKIKVLEALALVTKEKISSFLVKGQYNGYKKEIGGESQTETYVAFKTYVNLPRWMGVPFYIRTGKKLGKKITEISVHFREPVRILFKDAVPNVLSFKIQPDEAVNLQISNKIPGFGIKLDWARLDFTYRRAFHYEIPSAYERLLLDFLEGDQRLFIRSDEIEAAWKFVDSITQNPLFKKMTLCKYKPGTSGPKEAGEWMGRDLKKWWTR